MKVLALAVLLLATPAMAAEMLEWIDEKGVRNFTDNPNRVPEKYRSKATISPGIQATPEAIERDAKRRRREEAEAAERARQREAENVARARQELARQQELQRQWDEANADAQFSQIAAICARRSGIEVVHKPGRVTTLGSNRQLFDFDKCMTENGQPTRLGR